MSKVLSRCSCFSHDIASQIETRRHPMLNSDLDLVFLSCVKKLPPSARVFPERQSCLVNHFIPFFVDKSIKMCATWDFLTVENVWDFF